MESASLPAEVLATVVAVLEDEGIDYMMAGSVALAIHATPRATQDVDVVINPDAAGLDRLVERFSASARYYISPEAAKQAYAGRGMFNVIDLATGWKVDFIILKARDFSQTEFRRRMETDAAGIRLFVASPEDVVVAKLEWAKIGGSARQIEDVATILRDSELNLDLPYTERWVRELELEKQWNAAKSAAGG